MQKFTGKQYLQIDIASNYGLDKETWEHRLNWFEQNQGNLDNLVKTAKEPALFYAGVLAWKDAQQQKATGYPISLDATSSGLQLLACLTGDRQAAQLCNVVSTGQREDAYTNIYDYMLGITGDSAKISRDMAKDAVMTSLYGSEAVPKRVFGTGRLLGIFFDTMEKLAPAAWELNQAFLTMWNPNALSHDWVLPDNFHVHVKVISQVSNTVHFLDEPFEVFTKVNAPIEEGRSLGANSIHSVDGMVVREIVRRCDYNPVQIALVRDALETDVNPEFLTETEDTKMVKILWNHYEESGYLSARILDHLHYGTAHLVQKEPVIELLDSLPAKPFKVLTVHDCFRCLPNYGNDLRMQYNRQLFEIARSNLLSFIVSQILQRRVSLGKLDPKLHLDILSTDYALS